MGLALSHGYYSKYAGQSLNAKENVGTNTEVRS